MQPIQNQRPKKWLAVLVAGIILFVGGGGTGYMLGQQQAKAQQTQQMKKAPKGLGGKGPSGQPSGAPSQSSSSN
ncbi:hypothetical protein [Levilactobacillus acidifarinae]|uniref:Uncharacterized protein n=1 Tax=Levilactobacillus acidifarinae DSM 19394 = JCM 15949 TaxID=1423715 RepID=A0A0R1LW97_9LACO|nr:hypothetical protein [Levilactobacillus acidifarinae]KRK96698.1 hypothetical protein FD25_GL001777 [Levilactobacillus acidifarinae DSM 19394]GEO70395.1 hypothetical protein LAC03_23050 [Levilactobacillus acidifarinae]